jgi:hypothetical protein
LRRQTADAWPQCGPDRSESSARSAGAGRQRASDQQSRCEPRERGRVACRAKLRAKIIEIQGFERSARRPQAAEDMMSVEADR